MKIRPSIRLYFLVATLLTGILTIGSLTIISVNYFFSGMDIAMTGFLRSQAIEIPLKEGGKPVKLDDLTIAASLEELPIEIQQNLNWAEAIPNELLKKVDGIPIFGPPEFGYFGMRVEAGNKVRYISLLLLDMEDDDYFEEELPPFIHIIIAGMAAIVIFAIVLILMQRQISSPVEKLKNWAKKLDKDQLTQPVPNFHYSELNTLADIIRTSLSSVQESLEREQRFLGYASHELRTPIAVTRTNSELLKKMLTKQVSVEKQIAVLERIERAGLTMTDLTETLLWLNRQEGKLLPSKVVNIGELILQIESDLHYLLQGKEVAVNVSSDDTELEMPEGLLRIVLANLIRNAYQHTYSGQVTIEQSNTKIKITNLNLADDGSDLNDELGFGLGLELTERLVKQYGWGYVVTPFADGRCVELVLKSAL